MVRMADYSSAADVLLGCLSASRVPPVDWGQRTEIGVCYQYDCRVIRQWEPYGIIEREFVVSSVIIIMWANRFTLSILTQHRRYDKSGTRNATPVACNLPAVRGRTTALLRSAAPSFFLHSCLLYSVCCLPLALFLLDASPVLAYHSAAMKTTVGFWKRTGKGTG